MDNKFILFLAFFFCLLGIIKINPLLVLSGITMMLFLIFDNYYNYEENKKFKVFTSSKFKLAGIFGKIDLIFGLLLLLKGITGIIPNIIIIIFAFIYGIKALPFVFGKDIASIIDIILVIVIFFNLIIFPPVALIIISIYIIQKGVLSLL